MRNLLLCSILLVLLLVACQSSEGKETIRAVTPSIEVKESDGTLSDVIRLSNTLQPKLGLTFNGLADEDTMMKLLDALATHQMKATFFIEGMRVAQEPELVQKILAHGHEVQNGTLTFADMSELNYEQTYKEFFLANQIFEKHLGYAPQYVRSRSGDATESMRLAAATLGLKAVVEYSINPQDRNMQSAEEIVTYIERFWSSGAIIHLNTYINPAVIEAISLLAGKANEKSYKLTTLSEVLENQYTVRKLEEIEGYDAIQMNANYEDAEPHIYYRKNTTKKEVALTFDDWASEERTKEILDVLRQYDIKSTFFLIGSGVEKDPHLAKMILDEGHEVASHSYYHRNITEMTPEELQEDIVKTHHALTYALQESPLLYFRPAQGVIDEKSAKVVAATGMKTIALYDIASFDWNTDYALQDIYNRIMERVAPGKIIVMHVLDGTETVEALPLIIEQLQQQGYTFEKLSTWIEQHSEESVD
ncbi:polysaccharide deacetylase family protein [Metasolibacillus meyeri]|uniref:polysaccharide deacetylase family protein n=1 Tax=Metasolibacillus meyeri TaxID=1071052 RepID=UPI000D2FA761|nr:polysaccharide deacetylase family protein [Metasolibacillus meyeri]